MAIGKYLAGLTHRPRWIHHPCAVSHRGLWMIDQADKILALNRWDVELTELVCGSRRKVAQIYPASNECQRSQDDGFRRRYKIDGDYILWAGAWLPAKGVQKLSQRFLLFRNRHPDSNLKLVVFGGYGKAEFPIPHPDIIAVSHNATDLPSALKECLFVAFNAPPHPVGYDANPLILLEALMHGKTFVAQSGTPFLAEIARLGVVVKTDAEWLEAVETLVFNRDKCQALERACKQAYREKYNFSRMMTGVEAVLTELLGPRSDDDQPPTTRARRSTDSPNSC